MDPVEADRDGHPQYSPRRPFHSLRIRHPGTLIHRAAPPLSEGGECLRALRAPNAALTSFPRRPRPPNSPKNRKNGLRASPAPSFGMTDSGGQGLPALPIPSQGESSGFRLTTPSGKNGVSFMRGRMGGERGKTSGFFVFSKEVAGGGISSGFPGNHGRGGGDGGRAGRQGRARYFSVPQGKSVGRSLRRRVRRREYLFG